MTVFGTDPVAAEVDRVLRLLAAGPAPADRLETRHVDLKEEAGRRDGATLRPGTSENETAAKALAGEAVCMANTPGGGVLVVGAQDDGTLVGTALDPEWLRRRVYDLTQRELTVTATEVECAGVRLLLVRSPEAVHPIPWNHRYRHRVDESCVEIDPSTWEAQKRLRTGYDWSAQASGLDADAARPSALQRARDFLVAAGDDHSAELAGLRDADLLRRLDVVTRDGRLSNAGAVAFVGRDTPAIDYVRREVTGGDSVQRLRPGGRGLLEELYDIDATLAASNPVRHLPAGLVQRQVRLLPPRAVREALVNGVAHRDWSVVDPTHVEQIGSRLIVTSPGGFVGGVTPQNIITHPSQPRNRALAELLAALHVAEREGIGVDRMVGDMVRLGYQPPTIEEVPGPQVRAVLLGSTLDLGWMAFLADLSPSTSAQDLDSLLLLQRLVSTWWVDVSSAAPVLQRTPAEAVDALAGLSAVRLPGGGAVVEPVAGVPAAAAPAWTLTGTARTALAARDEETGTTRRQPTRGQVAESWAAARGRISSTELGSLVGAHPSNLGAVLKTLEQEGVLRPGRETRRGAGFFYLYDHRGAGDGD